MNVSGTIHGETTFTASTVLERYRFVRLKDGSTAIPPEVEYTDNGIIIGITDESANAGELVVVKPLNTEGTFDVECEIDTTIVNGSPLFVAASGGKATDLDTSFYVGQSMESPSQSGQIIQIAGVVGAVATGDASDITVVDADDYFTGDNVESVLAEIGYELNKPDYEQGISIYETMRIDPTTYEILDKSQLGGYLASDTSDIITYVDTPNSTVTYAKCNITGAHSSTAFSLQVFPQYQYDETKGLKFKLYYRNADAGGSWRVIVHALGLKTDGSVVYDSDGMTLNQQTTFGSQESLELLLSEPDCMMIQFNIDIENYDGVGTSLDMFSYALVYDRKLG